MSPNAAAASDAYLTRPEVLSRYKIKPPTLKKWLRVGYFPKPVHIGPNGTSVHQRARWPMRDIEEFDRRLLERRAA